MLNDEDKISRMLHLAKMLSEEIDSLDAQEYGEIEQYDYRHDGMNAISPMLEAFNRLGEQVTHLVGNDEVTGLSY